MLERSNKGGARTLREPRNGSLRTGHSFLVQCSFLALLSHKNKKDGNFV